MWLIALLSVVALFFVAILYYLAKRHKPTELLKTLRRCPWTLGIFVLAMFFVVQILNHLGITNWLATTLDSANSDILTYGGASFLAANLINNIPMSVLFSQIANTSPAIYASIIGSNIGAFATPIGALAGLMWLKILHHHQVKFNFLQFIKYGVVIAVPTLLAALVGLWLVLG
jgi:arsenical pump membrane protein